MYPPPNWLVQVSALITTDRVIVTFSMSFVSPTRTISSGSRVELEGHGLLTFHNQVHNFYWSNHPSVFTDQVLVGSPAGGASKSSTIEGDLVLHRLIDKIFERGHPHPFDLLGNPVIE